MNSIHSRYPAIPLSPELILVGSTPQSHHTELQHGEFKTDVSEDICHE
jgi:hypothetical protein